jgi:hypothetical protein
MPLSDSVDMYSMAYVDENLSDDDQAKFNWQFFGIPFRSLATLLALEGAWVRQFNEASSGYDKWESLTGEDVLVSFRGYELAQPQEKMYTFGGILENRDTTIVLGKSVVPYYAGQHLLANPFTASVNISDMVFGNNTEATVYIYHSGSYADWNADQENGRLGTGRGQYLAVPQNVAAMILPSIPSMQGFIVRATDDNGSITIPYTAVTKNTGRQRVRKVKHMNPYLSVELSGQQELDRVWLLYEPTASKQFDNGWDGFKLSSQAGNAMIYANEPAGNLQVNTVSDFKEIYLHFVPGKNDSYTLKIANNQMNELYDELFLVDLYEGSVISIQSDTTVYNFTVSNSDMPLNRFKITSGVNPNNQEEDLIRIYSVDNNTVVVHNLTNENGVYALFDISGRMLRKSVLSAGAYTTFKMTDSEGVMFLNASAGTVQKTEKILIRK